MRRSRNRLKRRLIALFLLFVAFLVFLTVQYRPLMLDSACNLARNTANEAINQTVCNMLKERKTEYGDLISITYNTDGHITALQANAANINGIKAETALRVRQTMSNHAVQELSVPLGTLCGSTLLSGLGPPIKCKSLLTAIPTVSLEYHFDGAGINQTIHSIIMVVTVPLSITLPLQSRDVEVKASFIIGETVLLGEVPDSYTNVISDPEVADDIFNYGDVG